METAVTNAFSEVLAISIARIWSHAERFDTCRQDRIEKLQRDLLLLLKDEILRHRRSLSPLCIISPALG